MASLNQFAASLIGPLALAMGCFVGSRNWIGRLVFLGALGSICAAIYLTGSRGALLGVVVMAIVFVFRFRSHWQVLLVVCLLLIVATVMPAAFIDRIVSVADKDSTGAGRTAIWAVGIEALETFGLFGGGFRSFPEIYGRTVPLNPMQGGRAPHNVYLGTWVEVGIIGLVLMLMALGAHLWAVHRARGLGSAKFATRAAEAACYGLLATSFFSDVMWTKFFWLPWIILAWGVQQQEGSGAKTEIGPPDHAR
jgi:O-antigen ligase